MYNYNQIQPDICPTDLSEFSIKLDYKSLFYVITLLPQRFVLPVLYKPHGCRVNNGIFQQKNFDVIRKCVLWVDSVIPICHAAQLSIEFVEWCVGVLYPSITQPLWQIQTHVQSSS